MMHQTCPGLVTFLFLNYIALATHLATVATLTCPLLPLSPFQP